MPDRPRAVVVNTTPIIALSLVGHLDLLQQLYGEVIIPPAVEIEVLAGGPAAVGVAELRRAPWIRVVALSDPGRADLLVNLDRGEAEVIALAQEMRADLVIVDERLARLYAKRLRLTLTGTLGVIIKAKERGLIVAVKPLIDELRRNGIRIGPRLTAEALRQSGES